MLRPTPFRSSSTRPDTPTRGQGRSAHRLGVAVGLALALVGCQDGMIDPDEITNDSCAASTSIAVGQSMGGSLSAGDCSQNGVWVDRWALDLASETTVRIDLSSGSFDAFLELHHAQGGMIAQNDDAGSLDSRINATLGAGSYVIVARSLGEGQSGSYQLSVAIGNDCSPVGTVEIGDRVAGEVSPSDCLFEWGGLMDNWRLDLARETGVRIEVESDDFDEALVVTDAFGEIHFVLDGFGPLGRARGDLMLGAGTWTLSAVSVFENPGSYELRVDPMPPCLTGKPLTLGETLSGTIDDADCLLHDWAPADSLVLELDRTTQLDFVVKSTDITPFLHVRDRDGHEVAWAYSEYNPNTGQPSGTARTSVSLDAGFYSVYVASDGYPSPWGDYEITVSEVICDDATTMVLDTVVVGTLETGDCIGPRGAFQDRYEFVLATDTTVRIDLESSAFDAHLTLFDSAGILIASDDDGGSGLNARIDMTLSAGAYTIGAEALGAGGSGSYSLSVGLPAASPSPASQRTELPDRTKAPTSVERTFGSLEYVADAIRAGFERAWGRAGKSPAIR